MAVAVRIGKVRFGSSWLGGYGRHGMLRHVAAGYGMAVEAGRGKLW